MHLQVTEWGKKENLLVNSVEEKLFRPERQLLTGSLGGVNRERNSSLLSRATSESWHHKQITKEAEITIMM